MSKIKDVVMKNHTAMFEVPVASQMHKYCKRGKRIRAGWQTALGRTTPGNMTVPTIVKNPPSTPTIGRLPHINDCYKDLFFKAQDDPSKYYDQHRSLHPGLNFT
ncbi:unnamed protein product [Echinostoma caproni]|uniref:YL1_C domain-containing protein n=1 Tax=Echinostoma caproni TaxID=27848 RepID=A0A183AY63_9TREM|nr:unnamed protein product [Echinostoma caproni]